MLLKKLELNGFKSFAKKSEFLFEAATTAIVGPNGSGKSNVVEAIRFVLGEQSSKSLRSKSGADLVYAGSEQTAKMNRASVAITFDNSERLFKLDNAKSESISIDFDEITISREVFSDGTNTYKINGHEVRLKDIHELIAGINIGASGHHIISQGEADRLLSANARDRREMIEEALGLKLYHYRIREAEKKLEKTHENLREAELSRREIAPHLKFLAKQVEKGKQAEALQDELTNLYLVYLKSQETLLNTTAEFLANRKHELEAENIRNEQTIRELRGTLSPNAESRFTAEILQTEKELRFVSQTKQDIAHKRGRIEGMIEFAKRQTGAERTRSVMIAIEEIKHLSGSVASMIEEALANGTLEAAQEALGEIKSITEGFIATHEARDAKPVQDPADTSELENELREITLHVSSLEEQENTLRSKLADLQNQQSQERAESHTSEDMLIAASESLATTRAGLARNEEQMRDLARQKELFFEDKEEGKALVGSAIEQYSTLGLDTEPSDASQRELRNKLERVKIKLEELGGGVNQDIIDEYHQTHERDEFLAREIHDLIESMKTLSDIIEKLKVELHKEFAAGITKINGEFQTFFETMFGGGKAKLSIVDIVSRKRGDEEPEDGPKEQGIDIAVSLPRKKITDIDMLSGGERSLTSIALLFSLSRVNPPPFLVLDETDAALDEANSQKYGNMIHELSKDSQLIVVTHNRETMSRADVLYGVTLGREGYSKLLSVKFEEAAAQYAK